tara:strand:- start:3755 stop:4030 length:276 start_codon:yes stop_codon:yes gene_type:complete
MDQAQQQGQQEEEVVINIGDLSTLLQVIDVVSTRGGFQGQELAGIGMLRNKLEAYLKQNTPQQGQGDSSVGEQAVGVDTAGAGELAGKLVD